MKSAEEWLLGGTVKRVLMNANDIRAVQLNALETAAKAVCLCCNEEPESLFEDERGYGHCLPDKGWEGPCDAEPVYCLMSLIRNQADQPKENTDV